jgi:error-prone DNA polymerase
MSHFDKDDVEEMGLLKLDVLGIRMQSSMAHAIDEIERTTGERIDLDDHDLDDPDTYALVQSARTLGCFQIESPGQRELIGKFAPETFGDLIIDISLFRPGPVKSDMVTPFLRARQGWSEPLYLHDDLRSTLEETCGVVVFHEQVLRIVATMTGCSLAEADETRRSMGSPGGQDDVRAWFYPAALQRGYDLPTVERVWDVLRAFASFGFCKAHAAAFALPTYQSAWLKAHHPAAFYAGILTHDPGMYPKRLILDDARNRGVAVLGLDINASADVYRIERDPTGRASGSRSPTSRASPRRRSPASSPASPTHRCPMPGSAAGCPAPRRSASSCPAGSMRCTASTCRRRCAREAA